MGDRGEAGGELAARREREAAAGLWPIRRALTITGVGAVMGLAAVTVVALALLPHLAASKGSLARPGGGGRPSPGFVWRNAFTAERGLFPLLAGHICGR